MMINMQIVSEQDLELNGWRVKQSKKEQCRKENRTRDGKTDSKKK